MPPLPVQIVQVRGSQWQFLFQPGRPDGSRFTSRSTAMERCRAQSAPLIASGAGRGKQAADSAGSVTASLKPCAVKELLGGGAGKNFRPAQRDGVLDDRHHAHACRKNQAVLAEQTALQPQVTGAVSGSWPARTAQATIRKERRGTASPRNVTVLAPCLRRMTGGTDTSRPLRSRPAPARKKCGGEFCCTSRARSCRFLLSAGDGAGTGKERRGC